MSDFSGKQAEIIDCFFRTGKINNQQRAVILPVLVSWIFKEKPEAENLIEEMLSKVRKEN